MKKESAGLFFALGVALTLLILSVVPPIGRGLNSGFEKHLAGYFTLAVTLGIEAILIRLPAPLLAAGLASGTYGALIELLQKLLPYRAATLVDALCDYAGALVGVAVLALVRWIVRARSRKVGNA